MGTPAKIPFGETATYGELARELGSAARAVGRANGRNRISIIVPCHRVIGANGHLTGYAGGIPTKQALLAHERLVRRAAIGAARRRVLTGHGVEGATAVRAARPLCVALRRPQPKTAKASDPSYDPPFSPRALQPAFAALDQHLSSLSAGEKGS